MIAWGRVPTALSGTLYRNGPDVCDALGISHPLDGDGRVDAIFFDNGTARALSRHVETPHRKEEIRKKAKIYRHAFGTMAGAFAPLKHSANTAVVRHAGTLLALWEGSVPYHLDPQTLETIGPHTLWGHVRKGESVCAHTKHIGKNLVFLCVRYFPSRTRLRFLEIGPDGALERQSECSVPGLAIIHDFGVTDTSFVFFCADQTFNLGNLARGESVVGCVVHGPAGTKAYTLSRSSDGTICEFTGPRFFVTHIASATDSDGISVDAIAAPTLNALSVPETYFVRLSLRDETCEFERVHMREAEFPSVRAGTQNNRFTYACSFTKMWAKVDHLSRRTKLFEIVPGALHMEPTFVPLGEKEDDGLVIGFVLIEGVPHVGIVNARTLAPMCVIHTPECNVFGLHSTFFDDNDSASSL